MACKVLVVCGSPVVASPELLCHLAGECGHIVAVDRGLDALLGAGLGCDLYVGDAFTPTTQLFPGNDYTVEAGGKAFKVMAEFEDVITVSKI